MLTPADHYRREATHMAGDRAQPGRDAIHESWFRDDTVDAWRHRRMYETVAPLATRLRDASWVTIGDGRYGLDAVRLGKLFGIKALPTDITGELLASGRDRGLFPAFAVENAERLSFADGSQDVVFCKEALHHCPRAPVALFEMLRAARRFVVLIEPLDQPLWGSPRRLLSAGVRALLGRPTDPGAWVRHPPDAWEDCGNYVYAPSLREIAKAVHSLDLGGLWWRGFNDHLESGAENAPATPGDPLFDRTVARIAALDRRSRRWPMLRPWQMATIVIATARCAPDERAALTSGGFSELVWRT